MRISRNGEDWGEITVQTDGQQVKFRAHGALPKYGEILRVWGIRDGAQPLLIGVAEPDHLFQSRRGHLHLISDLSGTEKDGILVPGALVYRGGKEFFHADGRASAVDVSGEGEEQF